MREREHCVKNLPKISYIKHDQIDYHRWDNCINNAPNGVIYAYSWYLDSVCDRWDAIIDEKYHTIMPVPIVRKRGKWRIKESSWLVQLGVFSVYPVSEDILKHYIEFLTQRYKRWQIPLNVHNPRILNGHKLPERFVRRKDLIYPVNLQKTISNADTETEKGEKMSITRGLQLAVIINFLLRIYGKKIKSTEILALRRLVSFSSRIGFGSAYSVYSSTNNLIGLTYVIRFHNRVYMLFCIADENTNRKKVFQLLLNRLYSDFEKQDLVLECNPRGDKELEAILQKNEFTQTPLGVVKKARRLLKRKGKKHFQQS